ncbi:MAG: response regulator [Candidatus Pacebacteria bacterium]|nr:response regulator [Candidatus Paceibacterota bacterium]
MKILIIEDERPKANLMREALEGLGEIVLCSPPGLGEEGFTFGEVTMPPLHEVIHLIGEADIVLLDHKLSTDYTGEDLLPHCRQKKVISISCEHSLGRPHFSGKGYLSPDRPHVAENLRTLVRKELGIS